MNRCLFAWHVFLCTETRAKCDPKEADDENGQLSTGDNRRAIRASIGDLSEFGKRYKGKRVSRKEIDDATDENEPADDDGDDQDDDEEDKASGEEEDGEMDDDDDDAEEEEEDDDAEKMEVPSKTKTKRKDAADNDEKGVNLIESSRKEDVAKGKAVKNQLSKCRRQNYF